MLYHCEVGFPADMRLPSGTFQLCYGNHAQREAKKDKVPFWQLPHSLDTRKATVIEVETNADGKPHKVVYRVKFYSEHDLILVVIVDRFPAFVKTLWLNGTTDTHATLNRSKYDRP